MIFLGFRVVIWRVPAATDNLQLVTCNDPVRDVSPAMRTRHGGLVLSSVLCPLSSVLCPLSSVLCPLSSVLCPLSSVLCPLSSVLCPLSSVLCPLSSVLCPLSSVLCPLSSVLCPLSSVLCLYSQTAPACRRRHDSKDSFCSGVYFFWRCMRRSQSTRCPSNSGPSIQANRVSLPTVTRQRPHMPVPSIIMGFRLTSVLMPKGLVVSETAFIMIAGPTVMTRPTPPCSNSC